MRNLKRALSLALASVMLLGMMVVGTSASYADVTSKQNKEAIEVAQAVGVMIGDDKGNFNPDAKVTRVEMAVVMSNLLNLKVDDFKAAKTGFTDVPAWAAPYVAACKADGIIAGYSATTFGSNDTVTAAQAALMMMKALGYFQFAPDFGDDWQLATVKQASKIKLYDGISANANTALTRNDVAQLVLNALEATMVEADGNGGTTIKGDGFEITTGSTKYVDVLKAGDKYAKIDKTKVNDKYTVELGEQLFDGKLEKNPDKDDLGRPAAKWSYKSEDIGTYGDIADKVYVLAKPYVVTDKDSLLSVLKDKNLTNNDELKLPEAESVYVNGTAVDKEYKSAKAAFNNEAKGGVVVELFYNDNNSNIVDRVVVLNYSINQIDDVSTKLTKDQKDDGATCKIKIKNASTYTDDKIADFNAKTYVEDAYLLYIVKGSEIVASQIAEEVTGTVTAIKGSDKATVGGTTYKFITKKDVNNKTVAMVEIDVEDEGSFYLNVAGQIAVVDTTSKSDNYAYIYAVSSDNGTNSEGVKTTTFTAYYVDTNGVKGSAEVDVDKVTEKEATGLKRDVGFYFADTAMAITEDYKGVIAYSLNSDKELVYETAKDKIAELNAKVDKTQANGTDSDTQFIFASKDGNKYKTSVSVGYKNVNIKATDVSYKVTNKDGDILYVFVSAENGTLSSDTKYAVVKSGDATRTKDGNDTIYTYSVVIDGEETTLSSKNDKLTLNKGEVFSYEMDGKYVKKGTINEMKFVKVTNGTKDYIAIGENQYNLSDADAIYTVTLEYKTEAAYKTAIGADTAGTELGLKDLDSVSVSKGADVNNKSWVAYKLDKNDLDILFVVDFVY